MNECNLPSAHLHVIHRTRLVSPSDKKYSRKEGWAARLELAVLVFTPCCLVHGGGGGGGGGGA